MHWMLSGFAFTPTRIKVKRQNSLIKLQPVIKLRPYQEKALQIFLEMKKGTIEAATATGKTFIAIEAIKRLKMPTVIVVPTIAILKTVWLRRLREAGFGFSVGVFYGQEKQFTPILITTYHSAVRHPEILDRYPFIIYDECHHLKPEVWGKLLDYAKKAEYAMGLTATLGKRYDSKTWKILQVLPVIFTYRIAQARREGWVAPIKVYSVPVQLTPEETVKYDNYTELIAKTASALRTTDPTYWSKLAKNGSPIAKRGLWALSKRRTLLSMAENKKPAVLKIVEANNNRKILLYSESIKAIEQLKKYLEQHGVKSGVYHSKIKKQWRDYILKVGWSRQFNLLLSCRALDEGLDVPEVSVGIIHCSGRTPRQIVQRLGRLIRPLPGKEAKVYVVWCLGTVERKVLSAVQTAVWKVR